MAKAKKKAAKKPKALKLVKPGAKKPARPTVASQGTARPRKRSETQPAIPGMEQVRNAILDGVTKNLADIRATINASRQDEAAEIQTGLREMKRIAQNLGQATYSYKANGVELVMVPGDAKLRVRALKDGGDGQSDGDQDEPLIPGADNPAGDVLDEAASDDQDATDPIPS
jgi:hypothetical protein